MIEPSQKHLASGRRFQFSIRSLLILTAIVAVLCSVGVTVHRKRVAARRPSHFIQAVQSGDLTETDRLLKIDPQLAHGRQHGGTSSSFTPLQSALVFGRNPKVVDRILQEKPDLDETADNGRTALHMVVERRMLSELTRLLRLGADANVVDDEGISPLHVAAQVDRDGQITKLLLDGGSDPNRAQPSTPKLGGRTPLHLAAEKGSAVAVMHLLDSGAQVNVRDMKGRTALHFSASRNHLEVSKLLAERGADLTVKDHAGQIPGQRSDGSNSESAALIWWERIVQLHEQEETAKLDEMLDAAPQVLSFRTEYTPATLLHRAVAKRRLDVLEYLLGRHMDPDVRGMRGQTPLHSACWSHVLVDSAKHLLDAGADIEAKDEFGQTPLHWAARAHSHNVLQMLIAEDADIGALDNAGTTVLDAAFERGFHREAGLRTLELLMQAGHAPTVLYAAATGNVDLLHKMTRGESESLDRGYTRNGVRPLHAAVHGRQSNVVEWLVDQGVECNPFTPAGPMAAQVDTPLMVALSYSMADMAILLIDLGADVNCRNSHGYYPVHAVIAWDRDPKILEALLIHGADPTLQYQNKTAVQLAIDSQSEHRDRYLELLDASGKDE